jgi:hypothetical protein
MLEGFHGLLPSSAVSGGEKMRADDSHKRGDRRRAAKALYIEKRTRFFKRERANASAAADRAQERTNQSAKPARVASFAAQKPLE